MGHVEWVQFARVAHVPAAGEVVHAGDPFEEPAGGGAVAAVQLARLAGSCPLVTALGSDERGRRSCGRLREFGVEVRARFLDLPTRNAVTLLDEHGERTIITFGERLEPRGGDSELVRQALSGTDAVYVTAGDVEVLRAAREAAPVLVASPRARHGLGHGIGVDALVLSADDAIELAALERAPDEAEVVVFTEGDRGGRYETRTGESGHWAAVPPPAPALDSYGCGDSFAAGLTYGLGAGLPLMGALELGARCGAFCITGRGPYERQVTAADI